MGDLINRSAEYVSIAMRLVQIPNNDDRTEFARAIARTWIV